MNGITWERSTKEKFEQMLAKVPAPMRSLAQDKVSKRAEMFVNEAGRTEVTEKDLVDAFFKETPGGFHGPMKVDMEALGLDYTKYGYEKDEWKNLFKR